MSLFIHGYVNLCDVMQCGTLSSMIRPYPLEEYLDFIHIAACREAVDDGV